VGRFTKFVEGAESGFAGKGGAKVAQGLSEAAGRIPYERSLCRTAGGALMMARTGVDKAVLVAAPKGALPSWSWDFAGRLMTGEVDGDEVVIKICALTHENAMALRRNFPLMAPRTFGVKTAVGTGDRLGIATPGHIRAVRGTGVVVFPAQQSIREMTRTHRSARQVMDEACWGVLEEGWGEGFGSDADHLKNTTDIDTCVAAGFTMFTIDPGDHVDDSADALEGGALGERFEAVDSDALETTAADLRREYLSGAVTLAGDVKLEPDEEMLARAAVKYGAAVAHTAAMFRHVAGAMGERAFELEMSVDETETPTTTFEHYFVARELSRLGVKWVSLAPRFVGEFEKGIDYRGDVKRFANSFAGHVAVMREFGPYKISIHSGSDKFSIYPVMAELADGLVHLKTAGTSYLEALRVIAHMAPELFREILEFAFERYDTDKASYHVSADPGKVKRPADLKDRALPKVLDGDDGRQLLHVTFGSVLTAQAQGRYIYRDRLLSALKSDEEDHYEALERHLRRHVEPFART